MDRSRVAMPMNNVDFWYQRALSNLLVCEAVLDYTEGSRIN